MKREISIPPLIDTDGTIINDNRMKAEALNSYFTAQTEILLTEMQYEHLREYEKTQPKTSAQWRRHGFSSGGGGRGHDLKNYLPPKNCFSSVFGHFILMTYGIRIFYKHSRKNEKTQNFLEDRPPAHKKYGVRTPDPPPPVGDAPA